MKITTRCLLLAGRAAEKFKIYSSFAPTPVNLNGLTTFGRNANQERSFQFLRHELPVRLANIMQEIQLLPDTLLEMPSVKTVVSWYENSFHDLILFDKVRSDDYANLSDFTDVLDTIQDRHYSVVETMAKGVQEMKQRHGIDPVSETQVQYFLDRFYLSRISIRMLIHQHILLFGGTIDVNPRYIGCIDPVCNLSIVLEEAYTAARRICARHYPNVPPPECKVQLTESREGSTEPGPLNMVYVPAHLFHMLFELLKNSMRATVEYNGTASSGLVPPIDVTIVGGEEDVTIKMSDYGSGIPRSLMDQVFKYTYSTAARVPDASKTSNDMDATPLAGYGYGLPLSRLYARYFHGDLQLCSIEGCGTDAMVYLKRQAREAGELLPVFNQTSARQYDRLCGVPGDDWSAPFLRVAGGR